MRSGADRPMTAVRAVKARRVKAYRREKPSCSYARTGRAHCVIPTVTTLRTLADVRVLIQCLPEDHRDNPTWRHVAAQLEQAAVGVDVVDLGIALRLALMLEGLKYQAQ